MIFRKRCQTSGYIVIVRSVCMEWTGNAMIPQPLRMLGVELMSGVAEVMIVQTPRICRCERFSSVSDCIGSRAQCGIVSVLRDFVRVCRIPRLISGISMMVDLDTGVHWHVHDRVAVLCSHTRRPQWSPIRIFTLRVYYCVFPVAVIPANEASWPTSD